MSQHYNDPEREDDPYSLPNVEVWESRIVVITSNCGVFEVPEEDECARGFCPSCDRATCVHDLDDDPKGIEYTNRTGWFYWFCLPGCLPDSTPHGPFETEQEAINAAQEE